MFQKLWQVHINCYLFYLMSLMSTNSSAGRAQNQKLQSGIRDPPIAAHNSMTMDSSTTVYHDHLKLNMVNFNPID